MTVTSNLRGTSEPHWRIGLTGPSIYQGAADPTVTPPAPIGSALSDGDVYIRTGTANEGVWLYEQGAWHRMPSGLSGGTYSGTITHDGDLIANANVTLGDATGDNVTINGNTAFPNALNTTDSIVIGGDANLYRSSADTLATDDSFDVGANLIIGNTGYFSDGIEASPSISFINATDAGMYLVGPTAIGISVGGVQAIEVTNPGVTTETIIRGDLTAQSMTVAGLSYPTSDGLPGQAVVTDGAGNLSFSNTGGDVSRIDKILKSSANIVDVFIYDTSKDSDGGAWRERCKHTSWYNEALGTATRGSTRKFPALAAIVAETDTVTIYDLTDADAPMWMVFAVSGTSNAIRNDSITSVVFRDGFLVVGMTQAGSPVTLTEIQFVADKITYRNSTGTFAYQGTIAERNDGLSVGGGTGGDPIADNNVNDVAITVLPSAPILEATGLPAPTIDGFTDGGTSRIWWAGSADEYVADLVDTASDTHVSGGITADGYSFAVNSTSTDVHGYSPVTASADSTSPDETYDAASTPALLEAVASTTVLTPIKTALAIGQTNGLNLIDRVPGKPATGLTAYITADYNTGWMVGDIKGAFLADTDATGLTGGTSPDRSVNGNDLTVNGSITVDPVATGADVVAYSGFSASNYFEQPYNADLDFGDNDFAISFWIKEAANSAVETVLERDSATTAQRFTVNITAAGVLQFITDDDTDVVTSTGPTIDDGVWRKVDLVMRGNTQEMWIGGALYDSDDATAVGSLSNASAVVQIGLAVDGAEPLTNGEVSLLRFSATAPTPAQIRAMYEAEKYLFRENAKATLGGTSDAVAVLDYDADSDQLAVSTGDGTSIFRGLERITYIDSTADTDLTTDNHDAVAISRHGYLIGSSAEAVIDFDAIVIRERLAQALAGNRVVLDSEGTLNFFGYTSDVSATAIGKIPVSENQAVTLNALATAKTISGPVAERAFFIIEGAAYRDPQGDVTLSNSTTKIIERTTSSMDADFAINTTTQTIDVVVEGVSATDIEWSVNVQIGRIGGANHVLGDR